MTSSPNIQCTPSGPGRGRPGQPGQEGENCAPLGNVLIVQEKSVETVPEASIEGGMILFSFPEEAERIDFLTLFNVEGSASSVTVVYDGTQRKEFAVTGLGRNAVQKVGINLEKVTSILVVFSGPSAVMNMSGCYAPGTLPPSVPTTPAPSIEDTPAPSIEEIPLPTSKPDPPTTVGTPTQEPPSGTPPTPGGGTPTKPPIGTAPPTPPGSQPTPLTPTRPPVDGCFEATVTFDTDSDGTVIPDGTYVNDEWLDTYGFKLGSMGGTGDFPRILDSSQPGTGALGRYVFCSLMHCAKRNCLLTRLLFDDSVR